MCLSKFAIYRFTLNSEIVDPYCRFELEGGDIANRLDRLVAPFSSYTNSFYS